MTTSHLSTPLSDIKLFRPAILILLLTSVMLLAGCAAGIDPEEREFFYRGWTNPNAPKKDQTKAFDATQPREFR